MGDIKLYGYRDFQNKRHEIDPMQIIGYETEPRGSCIMLTAGGAKLDNMSGYDVVKRDVEKMKAARQARAVLTAKPVGAAQAKFEVGYAEDKSWDDCIDHLVKQGILMEKTPWPYPEHPDKEGAA